VKFLEQVAPQLLERALLRLRPDDGHRDGGTLFLFNHLIERAADGGDLVLTFLVTSRHAANGPLGRIALSRHMVDDPEGASDELVVRDWAGVWSPRSDERPDVVVWPFFGLEEHAQRRCGPGSRVASSTRSNPRRLSSATSRERPPLCLPSRTTSAPAERLACRMPRLQVGDDSG